MTDRKVLVAVAEAPAAWGVVRFVQDYIVGKNVEVTLCFLLSEDLLGPEHDAVMDQLSAVCTENSAVMRIRKLSSEPHRDLEQLAAYADLLLIPKSALRVLALEHDFTHAPCAVIAVPDDYKKVDNILLFSDGSMAGVHGFKQFFQIFPHWLDEPGITLLRVLKPEPRPESAREEVLLLDYLKHYSDSIGVLKVPEPLTAKMLRPLKYDAHTLVVGRIDAMLSFYGDDHVFKPFFDDNSVLYMPSEPA